MQVRRMMYCVLAVVAFVGMALADKSAAGKWTAEVPAAGGGGGYGGGGPQTQTFTFKVDGDKLTGSVSGGRGETEIADGKINGDTISFSVTRGGGGYSTKQNFTGHVAGDEIHFKMTVEGRDPVTEFTAKKAK